MKGKYEKIFMVFDYQVGNLHPSKVTTCTVPCAVMFMQIVHFSCDSATSTN